MDTIWRHGVLVQPRLWLRRKVDRHPPSDCFLYDSNHSILRLEKNLTGINYGIYKQFCVCVCGYACVCTCVYMWRPEGNDQCLLIQLFIIFWDCLSLKLHLTDGGRLVGQRSLGIFLALCPGARVSDAQLCPVVAWVLEMQTQVLMHLQLVCYRLNYPTQFWITYS